MVKENKKKNSKAVPNIKLTARDVSILLLLFETRFLKREQIERLFFSTNGNLTDTTKNKANRRLTKLVNQEILERILKPVTIGKPHSVYIIGKNGYQILSKELEEDTRNLVYKKKARRVEFLFLEHSLGIAEFRVSLELALRDNTNTELLFWKKESKELNDKVTDPAGKQKYIPVRPDAFFVLKDEKGKYCFFLEIDLGTETLKRFSRKIIAYKEYWKSSKYAETYGFKYFRVLTVCESEKRLINLIEATQKAGGKNMFIFTVFSAIERKGIFQPIWISPVSNEPKSLI